MLKLCSASWQSLSAKKKRDLIKLRQINQVTETRQTVQVQSPPTTDPPSGSIFSTLLRSLLAKLGHKEIFQLSPARLLAFGGAPISYQVCSGQSIVCLLCIEALVKNKATQTRMTAHTAHPSKPVTRGKGSEGRKGLPGPGPPRQQPDTLPDNREVTGSPWVPWGQTHTSCYAACKVSCTPIFHFCLSHLMCCQLEISQLTLPFL